MQRFMVAVFALGMSACAFDSGGDRSEPQASDEGVATAEVSDPAAIPGDPLGDEGGVSPANAACGTGATNRQNRLVADAAVSGGARQRSGSSTGCATLGVLQPSDDAVYFCFTSGTDGFRWTYLRNVRTGVLGWSRADTLKDGGATIICCDGTCRPGCPC